MRNVVLASCLALLIAGCSVLPGNSEPRNAGARSAPTTATATTLRSAARLPTARSASAAQCLSQLGSAGVQFQPLADAYYDEGCSALNAVQMHALAGDRGQLGISNLGPVTCPVSAAFAGWARYGVDRAARQVFGSPLASIQTMGSYSCRNVAGSSRRSAHASAAAIDIAGFVLEDGRRISVEDGWEGSAREREFLRLVQRSACRRFGTVLGPDYNAAHRDHLHVEGVIEGSSYCR